MANIPWTVEEVVSATGGQCCFGNMANRFSGIAIDSRHAAPDELFVAICGEVHNGHRFAEAVIDVGGKGVLVNRHETGSLPMDRWKEKNVVCVAVEDTTRALGDLAAYNRRRSEASVIAITGSNGKTTTREMTAAVISGRFSTLTPRGNFNNNIGLPLTLLSLRTDHRCAILELCMNHPGEIRRLGEICRPDIGMITNIGPAHLEGVGTIEGVTKAKAELLETVKPGGTVILNADDGRVSGLADRTRNRIIRFGRSANADVRALSVSVEAESAIFTLLLAGEKRSIRLKSPGTFMVSNALAAAAVGHCLGLTAGEIGAGLERFEPVRGRLNIFKLGNEIRLIDDTYNANPESMSAAIDSLKALRGENRGIMVTGDMLELGSHAASLHRDIGAKAATSGISRLYVTGQFAVAVADGARAQSMDAGKIFIGTKEKILEHLIGRIRRGDRVLVKGSRGMRMETIVEGLKKWAGTGDK